MTERRDRVLVYLADLTHTGLQVATDNIPLNIGIVASYAKKLLGDAVELRLFKYPDVLLNALRTRPPDILGCSNYVWNSNLSEWMLGRAREIHPPIVTVQGGTNYPFTAAGQLELLAHRPNTDFHTFYEAEIAFVNLVERFIEADGDRARMKSAPIAGVHFLDPQSRALVAGPPAARLKALDEIPSPYATGLLDEFFDGRLTPIIETTRGCPFECNFCNAGDAYYTKVNMFPLDYVREEIEYIASRISTFGIANLIIADNNFGMYPRDADICRIIKRVQEQHGWPLGISATTGKNNKARILTATEILGRAMLVSMSVQSMTKQVLVNIKRDNIKLETYTQVNAALTGQGRASLAEVIFPLPGETYESFMRGVERLVASSTNKILSYTLQLNYGTDYKEPEYRTRHGYVGKWRLIPLDFGEYEGERVFDIEEVGVATSAASFDDYLKVRGFAFLTEVLYNNHIFREMLRYLEEYGISAYAWLRAAWDRRAEFPDDIKVVFDSFIRETQSELFDTEQEAIAFFRDPENYARLVRGEVGGNVIFKHKARLITRHMGTWIDYISAVALDLLRALPVYQVDPTRIGAEVDEIRRYLRHRLADALSPTVDADPITDHFDRDILAWVGDTARRRFEDYFRPLGVDYVFHFDDKQVVERRDSFRRYGTDPHGLAKILARVPSHDRLFRQVSPTGHAA